VSEQPGQDDDGTGPRQDTGWNAGDKPPDRAQYPTGHPPMGRPPVGGPVERTGWRALWLGVGALVVTMFFFPVGLVLGVAAIVVGIRARRSARQQHGIAPGAVPGIGLGLSTFSLALAVVLWPELNGYRQCLGSANTTTDERACRDQYFPKIEKKLNLPSGSMSRYGDLL
jgi:hypothetical protein